MISKYLTSDEICQMFKISKPTLWRWQTKSPYGKPFPLPALASSGGAKKRYLVSDVEAWENECINSKTAAA